MTAGTIRSYVRTHLFTNNELQLDKASYSKNGDESIPLCSNEVGRVGMCCIMGKKHPYRGYPLQKKWRLIHTSM